MCRSLLRVLEDNEKGVELILTTISYEAECANDPDTLFRSDSAATKLFSFYIKMAALRYLWHTLVLSVHSLNDAAGETFASYEGGTSTFMRHNMSDLK